MKRSNGFTLIELLAVIVILGVIMVIAVPAINKYIENSKIKSAESSATGYGDAIVFAVNNGEVDDNQQHSVSELDVSLKKRYFAKWWSSFN